MSLLTYGQARPWAAAIKEAVLTRKMPPWLADPAHGKFSNDRSLSKPEIDTLVNWVNSGAPEGDPTDAPLPRSFPEGWNIGKPDLVVEMPSDFTVPASGRVGYQYIVMPLNLTEDKWVQAAEARPGDHSVVHHITTFIRAPESKWLRGEALPGVPFRPPPNYPDGSPREDDTGMGSEILFFYAPGYDAQVLSPGRARKIRAGSDLVLEMHYTPNGTAARDRSRIGLVFSKEPVKERVIVTSIAPPGLLIPPGDPNHRVEAEMKVSHPGTLLSLYPHMHLRGKAFEFRLVYLNGKRETLLRVNKYSFHWQLDYRLEKPIMLVPGMKIECTAWYDNSENNPENPNPNLWVHQGAMSWDEMMAGVIQVAVDPKLTSMEWRAINRPR